MMKSKKPMINLDDTEDEEEDAMFEAEEARIKAAQLEKELEEQNKFDCLCDGVMNCLSLVDTSFNELLELKDELLQHDLPPSLQVAITLSMGKMFRTITDLHTPIQELTRLVNIYSIPWEQRSEALKKLHTDYESKQRQLNIAIRRLQLIDAHTKRLDMEKRVMNWEKAFAKITSAKSHGRRWKFMIEAFKKKIKEGINMNDLDVELSDDEDDLDQGEDDNVEQDDGVSEKQRFMLSVIAASPPAEDDGTPQAGSDIGSEGDGVPSEISDSSANVEDASPDIKQRRGVSFGSQVEEVHEVAVEMKPEMEDRGIWTHEPEYDTQLAVRLFRPLTLKDDDGSDVSCTVSFAGITTKTSALPSGNVSTQPDSQPIVDESEMGEAKVKGKGKAGRRKSIGFASRPTSPPAMSSPSKSMLKSKPSSILKKVKSGEDEPEPEKEKEKEKVNRSKFEEVLFDVPPNSSEPIRIAVHQGEQEKMVAMVTVTWDDLQTKEFATKLIAVKPDLDHKPEDKKEKEREKEEEVRAESPPQEMEETDTREFEEELSNQEIMMVQLQGIKLGIGGHSHGIIGELPLLFYWIKREKPRVLNADVNTVGVRELILEITGVDVDHVTKDEIVEMLGREYHDVSTSAMSFVSSSSHKSGYIPLEELEVIREQHDLEVKNIQDEYEAKLQQLLSEVGKLQTAQPTQQTSSQPRPEVTFSDTNTFVRPPPLPEISRQEMERPHSGGGNWRPPKIPQLPDWGAHLPKNVWERMKLLTEEMIAKRQQLDQRIRHHIAANIEKKLASQYKLQRADTTVRGPLQDVSLPAIFMPSRVGNVYNPRAHQYFHPTGTSGDLRLTQPPSIFQLPPLPDKAKMSVVNLFELSKNFENPNAADWLNRIASAHSRGSRVTTAGSRRTPNTPAPTANMQASDVYT
uniref:Uncharacterized protein LOC100180644 n=1 Tax=Phallusia mammillata TaxID=59560 RepID=A0A6F9DI63_9ASCI|nr:uncharacterized protein LOC100180644 [Phallusia mammillata]